MTVAADGVGRTVEQAPDADEPAEPQPEPAPTPAATLTSARVGDVMADDPIVAEVPGGRDEVLRLFVRHAVTGLPVVKAGTRTCVGVVTRSNVFAAPEEDQLALIMDRDPYVVGVGAPVAEAARIFHDRRIHTLPVVEDGGALVGVVSPTDLLALLADAGIETPVRDLVRDPPAPVHVDSPLPFVAAVMSATGRTALPVLDDEGTVVAMVTDGDVFQLVEEAEGLARTDLGLGADGDEWTWDGLRNVMNLYYDTHRIGLPDRPVRDAMSDGVHTAFSATTVSEAAETMHRRRVSQLPVVDADDRLLAVVTDLDLMGAATG